MSDAEKKGKGEFSERLKKEFGFAEDQLLKEIEEAEKASFDDSRLDGVEERMFQKLMVRKSKEEKAEVEKKAALETVSRKTSGEVKLEKTADTAWETIGNTTWEIAGKTTGEVTGKITEEIKGNITENTEAAETKKVVRFGKRKAVLSVALVAVFVMALGITAIGGKHYFMKKSSRDKSSSSIILDNDRNKVVVGKTDEAYKEIKKNLGIKVLKLDYVPKEMIFQGLEVNEFGAKMTFDYNENQIYLIQEKQQLSFSLSGKQDRDIDFSIYNNWLNQDIEITMNELKDGIKEYIVEIYIDNTFYWLMGIIPEDEVENIVKNINYF